VHLRRRRYDVLNSIVEPYHVVRSRETGQVVVEIVDTPAQAERLPLAPLLVLEPLRAWFDGRGLGRGQLDARRIGGGQSNVTFLVERDDVERFVLRRPPRPPLPPSAHDMPREATVQRALRGAGARVPEILGVCDDESVLGVPFYVMAFVPGEVVHAAVPAPLDTREERGRIAAELVDALAEIHAVDWLAAGLEGFGKPTGYLERQVRRFSGLWEVNATRDLPLVHEVAAWLDANRPESGQAAVVHGDYRLGNVMFEPTAPARLAAVLDWELATIGDPIADVGYLLSTWDESPLALTPVTRLEGFPGRDELAARYAEVSGRSVRDLGWYEALALWKSAVFCEAIYGRYLRGERGDDDPFGRLLERGVPALLEAAAARGEGGTGSTSG
jgi:aminoglycoside phosphotransferase (APT) family kinase protein